MRAFVSAQSLVSFSPSASRVLHSSTSQVAGILFPCSRKLSWKRASISSFSHRREARATVASAAIERRDSSYSPPWFSVAPMMDWTDNHYRTLARLISRRAWLYTEMIVADAINHQQENLDRMLEYPEFQHPIVLQLGGSSPEKLSKAAQLAKRYGYDEINLNCGCPSDKVAGHGCFGASLMLDPQLVGRALAAIAEGCPGIPVTVKCRIGVDHFDTYEFLYNFVATVASMSPTEHFIIHSRKAILKGLSPAANRNIPPLKYEFVYALINDFPHLKFTLNGGIDNIHQVCEGLKKGAHGVMLGRAAYNSPWAILGNVDNVVYGEARQGLTRRQVLEQYVEYADANLHKHGFKKPSIRHLVKPLLHLFHAEAGAGQWRRAVDESLRHSEDVRSLMKETLSILPDFVLDSPPPLEVSMEPVFCDLPPLPRLSSTQEHESDKIVEDERLLCNHS
ncbi:unnamed protein product [Sphagnum troendelagicum]|uniref:DUS-like FMN-binding domain-containing protein n=1 Tax=Sphagnum troendelagicum TaxID=128251 RepID=A0ABP0T778_9BRYO